MTLIRTKPSEMRFQGLFDNLFSPEFNGLNRSGLNASGLTFPKVNISQDKDSYHLELAVPGIAKEDVNIKLDQEILSISSEKKDEAQKEAKGYSRMEFSFTSFERKFNLPEDADSDKISANYINGILFIQIPKREETKPQPPKSIEIV